LASTSALFKYSQIEPASSPRLPAGPCFFCPVRTVSDNGRGRHRRARAAVCLCLPRRAELIGTGVRRGQGGPCNPAQSAMARRAAIRGVGGKRALGSGPWRVATWQPGKVATWQPGKARRHEARRAATPGRSRRLQTRAAPAAPRNEVLRRNKTREVSVRAPPARVRELGHGRELERGRAPGLFYRTFRARPTPSPRPHPFAPRTLSHPDLSRPRRGEAQSQPRALIEATLVELQAGKAPLKSPDLPAHDGMQQPRRGALSWMTW
jgi:hypothetical protein